MEYPKRSWCLYLKGIFNYFGDDLTKFDGYVGYELERDDLHAKIKIIGRLGYRESSDNKSNTDFSKGSIEHLKTGFISKYHLDYLEFILKDIETNRYINTRKEFWRVYSIFGYFKTIDVIIKHNGKISNECIEEIAELSEYIWTISRSKLGYLLECNYKIDIPIEINKLNSLECLRSYGLEHMEQAVEKTNSFISLEFQKKVDS